MEDPEADTEWNDILRARGILPPKSGPTEEELFEELDKEIRDKHDKHLEDKDLEELDELEDEEDERILMEYRKKRIAEMKAEATRGKFGQVIQISKPDFVKEVTETSKEAPVVVHLYKDPIVECKLVNKYLNDLAIKYKSTKFVKIIGDQCIPNYPDKNLPTLLIYYNGDLAQQLVGLSTLGGINMKSEALEKYLLSVDAIEDNEKKSGKKDFAEKQKSIKNSALSDDDDEEDVY